VAQKVAEEEVAKTMLEILASDVASNFLFLFLFTGMSHVCYMPIFLSHPNHVDTLS
jgi:hypothetical protein